MAVGIDLQGELRQRFGLEEFRDGQQRVIETLLAGRSAAAVFPTGGGKSLCYQLPAMLLPGLTVVVSPLIALMKDQIAGLARRGIPAVRLDSTLSNSEFRESMQSLRSGEAKLLYVAPERFFNERFRESLRECAISLFAVDEAHCISQWGHNFRPDYLKLGPLARQYGAERVLALTATATPQVLHDICQGLDIAPEDAVCTPFFRPNLYLRATAETEQGRDAALVEALRQQPAAATLVYVTLQHTAEQVAERLTREGLTARAYHAGMDDAVRTEVQDWFMQSEAPIVVATIAFGMGIDKADLRYVYHYNLPKSLENYAQEIGRAGRDGAVAVCQTLVVPEDRVVLENFVYGDTPTRGALETFLERLAGQPETFFISQYQLGTETDIRPIVLRTLLTYLELEGYLEGMAPRYEHYEFQPRISSQEILRQLDPERQKFIRQVLSFSVKRKVWFHIDPSQVAQKISCDRGRVIRALDYMGEQGWLELRFSGLMHGYRRLKQIEDPVGMADAMEQRLLERERNEVSRIDQVLALAAGESCQARALSEHFGQQIDQACGHCSACLGHGPLVWTPPRQQSLGTSALSGLGGLVQQHPQALSHPRQAARFLCGITSPALTSARLSRHGLFGCCSHIPFTQVLQACENLYQTPARRG
jgi:ATP-dependent DNA helicase RecQ